MSSRDNEDRLYPAVVLAFLIGLVAIGLLGVPALVVVAIGAAIAVLAITLFRPALEGRARTDRRRRVGHVKVPAKYVPSVLAPSTTRRRRGLRLRRHA